jgi:hypothetical protein
LRYKGAAKTKATMAAREKRDVIGATMAQRKQRDDYGLVKRDDIVAMVAQRKQRRRWRLGKNETSSARQWRSENSATTTAW